MSPPYRFEVTATTAELRAAHDGLDAGAETGIEATVAGRVMLHRAQGKLAFATMRDEVLSVLKDRALTIEQIERHIAPTDRELFVDVVRDMVDDGLLQYDPVWKLGIAGQKR